MGWLVTMHGNTDHLDPEVADEAEVTLRDKLAAVFSELVSLGHVGVAGEFHHSKGAPVNLADNPVAPATGVGSEPAAAEPAPPLVAAAPVPATPEPEPAGTTEPAPEVASPEPDTTESEAPAESAPETPPAG